MIQTEINIESGKDHILCGQKPEQKAEQAQIDDDVDLRPQLPQTRPVAKSEKQGQNQDSDFDHIHSICIRHQPFLIMAV